MFYYINSENQEIPTFKKLEKETFPDKLSKQIIVD